MTYLNYKESEISKGWLIDGVLIETGSVIENAPFVLLLRILSSPEPPSQILFLFWFVSHCRLHSLHIINDDERAENDQCTLPSVSLFTNVSASVYARRGFLRPSVVWVNWENWFPLVKKKKKNTYTSKYFSYIHTPNFPFLISTSAVI